MLKDAGLWLKETSKLVDRIHEECSICKQYSNIPSNPFMSIMSTAEPGKIVAVDLKEMKLQESDYIFYGIEVFLKSLFGFLIKDSTIKDIQFM